MNEAAWDFKTDSEFPLLSRSLRRTRGGQTAEMLFLSNSLANFYEGEETIATLGTVSLCLPYRFACNKRKVRGGGNPFI